LRGATRPDARPPPSSRPAMERITAFDALAVGDAANGKGFGGPEPVRARTVPRKPGRAPCRLPDASRAPDGIATRETARRHPSSTCSCRILSRIFVLMFHLNHSCCGLTHQVRPALLRPPHDSCSPPPRNLRVVPGDQDLRHLHPRNSGAACTAVLQPASLNDSSSVAPSPPSTPRPQPTTASITTAAG